MQQATFTSVHTPLKGTIQVPGDKSISHRAIILGSLAKGTTKITNFLDGEDCLQTINIFRQLGVSIEHEKTEVTIDSGGVHSFQEPLVPLYFGNSGTTARLMLGLLASMPFHTVVYGDPYLTVRPMDRVTIPLSKMGALIEGRQDGTLLPLAIKGTNLTSIYYEIPVKSAQVKSALLLAALHAEGETTIVERGMTRNHTEVMLKSFGGKIKTEHNTITISGDQALTAQNLFVPGDISSAAFWMVAAATVPDSKVSFEQVGLNNTRTGIIDVLTEMGAAVTITDEYISGGEKIGTITIVQQELQGTVIEGEIIPRLIDEIPIIALLATQAKGKTIIRNAEELRVKETDRIKAIVETLTTIGAKVEELEDGLIIHGKTTLQGGYVKSYGDHRMAMMGVIASLLSEEQVTIDDISVISISYPTFFDDLKKITNEPK